MKVNWTTLRRRIPNRVQLKPKVFYEIVWVSKDDKAPNVGETRPDNRQIVLELGHSDRETVHTYLHELAHAVSCEYELGLTESQVLTMEKSIYYLLKPENLFKPI